MRGPCRACLRQASTVRSIQAPSTTLNGTRSLSPRAVAVRSFATTSSNLARTRLSRQSRSSDLNTATDNDEAGEIDSDFNADFYNADQLEARLAKLEARAEQAEPSTSSSTATTPPRENDTLTVENRNNQYDDTPKTLEEEDTLEDLMEPIEEGLYEPPEVKQKPFGLYDLSLEEPDLGPTQLYGMKKKPRAKSAYPAVIKLRPDLDPIADEEEIEEKRRLGQIRRQGEKKRQLKGDFLDYTMIKLRGGRGGAGVASFSMAKDGGLGGPFGGNGGMGGSIYVTTTDRLTSLHTIPRRYMADQGKNGGRELRHGQAGDDIIITLPIGTVLREVIREGDEEKHWQRMEELDIPMEDRKWDRWERTFHLSQTDPFGEDTYIAAERLLRRDKIWATRTPTFEEKPPLVLDLDEAMDKPILIAKGGLGGKGNTFFAGITGYRQPRFSSRGITPYTSTFEVELKIIADVGLVGFPNAGKSTILRALTGRRAEVAGYQFTTLNPQVGVVKVWDDGSWGSGGAATMGGVVEETWKEKKKDAENRVLGDYAPLGRAPRLRTLRDIETASNGDEVARSIADEKVEAYRYTISDNPGLLPEAAENVGLGHSFLRSIERCLALAYVVDIARPNPEEDLIGLRHELEAYKPGLAAKGAVVILNKGDEADAEAGREKVQRVNEAIKGLEEGMQGRLRTVVVSGKFGLGLDKLVKLLGERVEEVRLEQDREEQAKREEWR